MAFTVSRARIAPCIAKVETTYGSDISPAGSVDAFYTIDSAVTASGDFTPIKFNVHNSTFSRAGLQHGKRALNRSFTWMWEGSGTLGSPHVAGDVLQACGMTETAVAGTSVAYTPAAITALKSMTLQADHGGGVLWTSLGCYGNIIMSGNVNDGVRCAFNGRSLWTAPSWGTITSWTPGTMRAKAALAIAGSVVPSTGTSWTPVIDSFSFNRGAVINDVEDMNQTTGLKELLFADATPTVQLVFAMDMDETSTTVRYAGTAAGTSLYQCLLDENTFEVGWTIGAGETGNSTHFYFPKLMLTNVQEGEKNGYRIVTCDFDAIDTAAANGEFTITVTSA